MPFGKGNKEKELTVAAGFTISDNARKQIAKRANNNALFQEIEMQNENQTATDNNVSVIEDLTLNETAAARVKGGVSIDNQGRLIVGTDQGIYHVGTGQLTLTGVIGD